MSFKSCLLDILADILGWEKLGPYNLKEVKLDGYSELRCPRCNRVLAFGKDRDDAYTKLGDSTDCFACGESFRDITTMMPDLRMK